MMLRLVGRSHAMAPLVVASRSFCRNVSNTASLLSQADLDSWHRQGYVVLKNLFSAEDKARIFKAVKEIQNFPLRMGEHMHYFEKQKGSEKPMWQLCRTENYLDYHAELQSLVGNESSPARVAAQLLGEDPNFEGPALVFKERINYKLPGGGGFAAHQDAPAWSGGDPTAPDAELHFMRHTLNMNIAIDPMFLENGGLEVVPGKHREGLFPQNADGTLTEAFCSSQTWQEVKLEPGDVLFFSLHIPHRSGPNLTQSSRRAVYITYAARSKMDPSERSRYYENYRRDFPPAGEHVADQAYSHGDSVYNWATPIAKEQPTAL